MGVAQALKSSVFFRRGMRARRVIKKVTRPPTIFYFGSLNSILSPAPNPIFFAVPPFNSKTYFAFLSGFIE